MIQDGKAALNNSINNQFCPKSKSQAGDRNLTKFRSVSKTEDRDGAIIAMACITPHLQ
jgi:hypothetical protein